MVSVMRFAAVSMESVMATSVAPAATEFSATSRTFVKVLHIGARLSCPVWCGEWCLPHPNISISSIFCQDLVEFVARQAAVSSLIVITATGARPHRADAAACVR